jgi:hypothetical protein
VVIDLTEPPEHTDSTCWLFRSEDGSPFAFGRGADFVRISDHTLWAQFRDNRLFSARSGQCLANLRGRVFHDAETDEPAYYVPASCPLPGEAVAV